MDISPRDGTELARCSSHGVSQGSRNRIPAVSAHDRAMFLFGECGRGHRRSLLINFLQSALVPSEGGQRAEAAVRVIALWTACCASPADVRADGGEEALLHASARVVCNRRYQAESILCYAIVPPLARLST